MATPKQKKKMFELQKRGIRYVINAPFRSHTSDIFLMLDVLPLPVLHEYYVFKFMIQLKDVDNTAHIFDYWNFNIPSSRLHHHLRIPFASTNKILKLPFFHFPKIYNKWIDIYNAPPILEFLPNLRLHMLKRFASEKKCNTRQCYICVNFSVQFSMREAEKNIKEHRKKLLIAHKKYKKAERYSELAEKAGMGEYEALNRLLSD